MEPRRACRLRRPHRMTFSRGQQLRHAKGRGPASGELFRASISGSSRSPRGRSRRSAMLKHFLPARSARSSFAARQSPANIFAAPSRRPQPRFPMASPSGIASVMSGIWMQINSCGFVGGRPMWCIRSAGPCIRYAVRESSIHIPTCFGQHLWASAPWDRSGPC